MTIAPSSPVDPLGNEETGSGPAFSYFEYGQLEQRPDCTDRFSAALEPEPSASEPESGTGAGAGHRRGLVVRLGALLRTSPAATGGLAFLSATTAVNLSNFVFHVALSRLLGPSDYSALGSLLNILTILSVPLGALQATVTQAEARARASGGGVSLRALAWRAGLWSLVATVGLAALSPVFRGFLHLSSPWSVLILSAWVLPSALGAVLQGVLMGRLRFAPVAFAMAGGQGLGRFAIGVALVATGAGVEGAVAASVIGQAVTAGALSLVVRRELVNRSSQHRRNVGGRQAALSLLALGGYAVLVSMDTVLARHYLSSRQAGWYTAAATAGKIALFLPGAVTTLSFPRFSVGEGRSPQARSALRMAVPATLALGLTAAVVLSVFSGLAVSLLFGPSYAGADSSVPLLGLDAMLLGLVSLLTYFNLARRSAASLLNWVGVGLAATGIAVFHRTPGAIALDMVLATGLTLVLAVVGSCRQMARGRVTPALQAQDGSAILPTGGPDLDRCLPSVQPDASPAPLTLQLVAVEAGPTLGLPPTPPASEQATRPLRLLLLNWRDSEHRRSGGAEVYAERVAAAWAAQGHSVTLLTRAFRGAPTQVTRHGFQLLRLGHTATMQWHAWRYYRRHAAELDGVIEFVNALPFLAPLYVKQTPGIALFHQTAEEIWHHELPRPLALIGKHLVEPWWLKRYRRFPAIAVSNSTRDSLVRRGLTGISLVPEGVDYLHHPGPLPPKERVPTILFVGRLTSNKRPDHAIEAYRLLKQHMPDAVLWIVGVGPMADALRSAAPAGTVFFGRVPEDTKQELMARAHVLVATSVREGWGLTVSEAALLGTRAIGYDVPGLRDSVPAAGGLLVEAHPAALANALGASLRAWIANYGDLPSDVGVKSWHTVASHVMDALASSQIRQPGPSRHGRNATVSPPATTHSSYLSATRQTVHAP
jgi:glycosyltransferase involved in cell wall biosynthesis/O-antigen/teichoic acid export membrane protein